LLGSRLTVLAVAASPEEPAGCCDLKTSLWKRPQVDLALEQLKNARQQLDAHGGVTFALGEGPMVADVVAREAEDRGCDLIIVPDERRRRLRRTLADRVRQRTQSRVTTPTELSRRGPSFRFARLPLATSHRP
jgi:nucleotide-binding universal stress UspA family protein